MRTLCVCVCVCGKGKTISNWNFGIVVNTSCIGSYAKRYGTQTRLCFCFCFRGWIVITIQKHIRPIDNEYDDDEFYPRYQNTNPNALNLFCWCLILYQNVANAYCVCVNDCDMRFLGGSKNVDM